MKFNYPIPENESDRLLALERYDLMDSGEEEEFDAIARIAAAICQIPITLITFINSDRQYFKSHLGTELNENSRAFSFCTHAIASGEEIMIVPDATMDDRFKENPMVAGPTGVVFYAGVPLINKEGFALGTLCVLDKKTHQLSDAQVDAMKSLSKQIVDKVELRDRIIRLEQKNLELTNANVLIQKFASMAAHDIKNPLASMLMTAELLSVRAGKWGDERAEKLLETSVRSTKTLLTLVDEMLDYSKAPGLLTAKKQRINLNTLFDRIKTLLYLPEGFTINFSSDSPEIQQSSIALEQILLNLLSNAIRYNDKTNGEIIVHFFKEQDFDVMRVADNGIGIAQEHHERIFTANFTLQQADRFDKKGSGIGLSTIKDLIAILKGNILLESVVGQGSVFTIKFPN